VDIDRHLADESWAMEVSSRSDDFKEYGQASREKREPKFEGR
jgi:2-(1,2-epoxy-1,2-dihydrophenyl)acetyl-CoA isomerase